MDLVLFSKVAFFDWTVNLTAEFRRRLEIVRVEMQFKMSCEGGLGQVLV